MLKTLSLRKFAEKQRFINLASNLAPTEQVLIVDSDNKPIGTSTRKEMRRDNLWHRSSSIFVSNYAHEFVVHKRSSKKDYFPGWIDLAAGGVVSPEESNFENACREAYEEYGIDEPNPEFLFTFPFEDESSKAYVNVFFQQYDGKITPQESEIDGVYKWKVDKVLEKIQQGAKITPDSKVAFLKFLPYYEQMIRENRLRGAEIANYRDIV